MSLWGRNKNKKNAHVTTVDIATMTSFNNNSSHNDVDVE